MIRTVTQSPYVSAQGELVAQATGPERHAEGGWLELVTRATVRDGARIHSGRLEPQNRRNA